MEDFLRALAHVLRHAHNFAALLHVVVQVIDAVALVRQLREALLGRREVLVEVELVERRRRELPQGGLV